LTESAEVQSSESSSALLFCSESAASEVKHSVFSAETTNGDPKTKKGIIVLSYCFQGKITPH